MTVEIGAGEYSCRAAFLDDHHLVVSGRRRTPAVIQLTEPPAIRPLTSVAESDLIDIAVHPPSRRCAFVGWKAVHVGRIAADANSELQLELQFVWPRKGGPSAAWSIDGRLLALSDEGGVIDVLSVEDSGGPQSVASYQLLDEVRSMAFSVEGRLYAGCGTGAVFVSNPGARESAAIVPAKGIMGWQGHVDRINAVAVSPIDGSVLTGSRDDLVRAWQPAPDSGVRVLSEGLAPRVSAPGIAMLPGRDRVLAVGTGELTEWDLISGDVMGRTEPNGRVRDRIAVSPDGRFVATSKMLEEPFVEIWSRSESAGPGRPTHATGTGSSGADARESQVASNAVRFTPMQRLNIQRCSGMAFSPDSRLVAVVDFQHDTVLLVAPETGAVVRQLPAEQPHCAVFSPDNHRLIVTSLDGADVWDCATWQKLCRLSGHSSTTVIAAVSPDSRVVATGSHDRSVRLWDTETGTELQRLLGHSDWIEDLVFSPDGRSLVSASQDGFVKVWHVETGEFLCDLERRETNRVFRLAFCTPSGKLAMRLERGQLILLNTGARD
ncbi:MAG: hypothetical protein R3C19_06670 [Planctomycetaceae bacterium]